MKIVINDANIWIDLVKLDLLQAFSQLDFELHTTDFVLEELHDNQKESVQLLHQKGMLNIIETTETEDFINISNLTDKSTGLSFEDCSVWYYSKKLSGILLTGDGKLRKHATKDGVEVKGLIYILDCLLSQNILNFAQAIEKLNQLYAVNNRLPKQEIERRNLAWQKNEYIN